MKSQNFLKWTLGAALGVLPFAGGCLQQNAPPPVQTAAAVTPVTVPVNYAAPTEFAAAEPAEYAAATAAEPVPAAEAPQELTNLTEAAVEPISSPQTAPQKVNLTPGAAELARMANSGVDEKVMLAYVTNSPSTFNLGADEIIYLNDLGVPGDVVTAMIQRDQVLRASGQAAMAASAQAMAPAPQPAPAQVAPQAVAPQMTAPVEAPLTPPEGDVTTDTFYDSLAPYGTWVNVSGYGRCWRPTVAVVNVGWEPYFDSGRWVYTDYGWYWVSDYSWGWAPFHYGRWFRHASWGWCWAPDTVWGPSWVAWRSSDAYCGWAPLPPGAYFTFGIGLTFHGRRCYDWNDCGLSPRHGHFVAWRDFDRHGLHSYAVRGQERNTIYRNTTVVNNITVNNNTVINRGVPRDRVAAVTHRDVRPVTVRETTSPGSHQAGSRPEQLRGNTLTVYRPVANTQTRNSGAAGTHNRPDFNNRAGSAASAPSSPSSPSATFGTGNRQPSVSRPNAGQTRTGATISRNPEPEVSTRTTQPLQSPAATAREPRVAPTTRQPTYPSVSSPAPVQRYQPAPNQSAPVQRYQPAPSQSAPGRSGQAPGRSENRPVDTPSRAPTPSPRSSAAPAYKPAPAYNAQASTATRSYNTAPSAPQRTFSNPREAVVIPRQAPTVSQAPRYSSAPAQPSYTPQTQPQRSYTPAPQPQRSYTPAPQPQRSYTPAPSYSRPAPEARQQYSAPAPRAAAPQPAPAPSRSSDNSNRGNNGRRNN